MAFRMSVAGGPNKGQVFDLKPGTIIGRAGVDICLDDPKISSRHAKIEFTSFEEWQLVDMGSTNGIRHNGKKIKLIPLSHGLQVKIGNTPCEFIEVSKSAEPPPVVPSRPTAAKQADTPEPMAWHQYFSQLSAKAQAKIPDKPKRMIPFKPLVVLKFVRGPQAGIEWTLGYGPRQIGLASLDFPILEPHSPPIICTITPKGISAFFETAHSEKVRLNDQARSSEMLKAGDHIIIGGTHILVSYRE